MSHQVIIPAAGESITSASIGEWHVADGDPVSVGQNLVTLETDKVSQELEAEVAGTIKLLIAEGEEAEIGAVIAEIVEAEASASSAAAAPTEAPKKEEDTEKAAPAAEAPAGGDPIDLQIPSFGDSINSASVGAWNFSDGDTVNKGDVLVTLESDKVSSELEAPESGTLKISVAEGEEVEIGALIGQLLPGAGSAAPAPAESPAPSAAGAEEERSDAEIAALVKAAATPPAQQATSQPAETATTKAAPTGGADEESRTTRKKMSMLRRKISQHLVNAQHTAAILTTFNEVDMSAIMTLRKTVQETFVAKHGVKLGFMSFFVKAVVNALKEVPAINGRIDGTDVIQNHYYDMGVAIGTEKGLVVPVIRDPDQMSFAEIEQSIKDYAVKAMEGKIELTDLQGGVFTISNGGTYGSLLSTPILNPPQSGILGMHTIQQRPVAVNGEVQIRPMMYLALSYDHRLVDGKEAVTFLIKIKESLENPTRLMLEL